MKKTMLSFGLNLPADIKKCFLNLPARTRVRRLCKVVPSNGKAPHINTYRTTPIL